MPWGKVISKNAKFVNEYLKENYKQGCSMADGLKWVATAMNNNVDHPKKNSEIMVVTKQSISFLPEKELIKLYDSIDEE